MTTAEEIRKRGYLIHPDVEIIVRRRLTVEQYDALVNWDPNNPNAQKALVALENLLYSSKDSHTCYILSDFLDGKRKELAHVLLPKEVATEVQHRFSVEHIVTTSVQLNCECCSHSPIPGLLLNEELTWDNEKRTMALQPIEPPDDQITIVLNCPVCKPFKAVDEPYTSNHTAVIFLARLLGITPKFTLRRETKGLGTSYSYSYRHPHIPMSLEDIKKALGK